MTHLIARSPRDVLARIRTLINRRSGSVAAMVLLLVVLALVMVIAIRSPEKDDVAWLLYVARKWLAGQRLYVDLIEVNPPLIVWIYAIPAKIAVWLHVQPKLIAVPFFASLVLGSAWWCACLLHKRGPLFAHRVPVFVLVGIVLLVLPGVEFGQREHLMTASILPYLCVMASWLNGEPTKRRTGIAVGIVAGLGCALKPIYGLTFVLPELLGLLWGRQLIRSAPIAACVSALLYAGSILLFCPAYLDSAVPLALALYRGTDTSLPNLLDSARVLLFGAPATVILWMLFRQRLAARGSFTLALTAALSCFAVGATAVYFLQGKDWFYHRIPATMAIVLAVVLWIAEVMPRRAHPERAVPLMRLGPAAALAGLVLLAFVATSMERMQSWVAEAVEPSTSAEVRLEQIIKREHAKSYIAFSEWMQLGFPVVNNTGVVWTSRFDSMWAVRGELWRTHEDGRAPRAWPIRHWVAQDFIAGCPDIAVVDARGGINYLTVLLTSEASFAHAWTHYRQIAMFDGLRVFQRQGQGCVNPHTLPRIATAALLAP